MRVDFYGHAAQGRRWGLLPALLTALVLLNGCTETVPPVGEDRPPDVPLAEFKGVNITTHQFLDAFKVDGNMERPVMAQANETSYIVPFLEELAVDMVLATDARESGLPESATAQRADRDLLEKTLLDEIIRREVDARVQVTEAEIRDFYDENIDQFSEPTYFTMRNLFVAAPLDQPENRQKAREKIENAKAALDRGKQFWEIARIYSEVEPNNRGVELGPYQPGEIVVVEVDEALQELGPGEISDIIETDRGFYIVQLVRRTPGVTRELEQVKTTIRNAIYESKRTQRLAEFYEELREEYEGEFEIYPELINDLIAPDEAPIVKAGRYTLTLGQYFDLRQIKGMDVTQADVQHLNAIVNNYLALTHAHDVGLVEAPNVQRAHTVRRVRWLADRHLRRLVRPGITPTEQDLRLFFTQNRGRYRIPPRARAYELFIQTEKTDDMFLHQVERAEREAQQKALGLIQAIMNGADFMELARHYSNRPRTASRGGEIGWITPGTHQLYDDVFFVRQQLQEGEITRWPVQSTEGWYLFYNRERVPGKELTYEEAKPQIRQDFIAEKEVILLQVTRDETRKKMAIDVNQEALEKTANYLNEAAKDIQGRRLY